MANKIKPFFKQHWLALVLAVVVGLISASPQLLAIISLGAEYQNIPFFGINDNLYYTAKIQEIADGHWTAASPFMFEYKNVYPLVLPIGESFYFILSKLFWLSAPGAVLLAKFLFPAVLFFLIYWLIFKIIQQDIGAWPEKITSLAGGLLVVLGYNLIDFKNAGLFILGQKPYFSLPLWTRPVNPITGALLLMIFLLLIWRIINRPESLAKYAFLWPGLIMGSMIYYFFSWGAAMSVLGVLAVIYLIKKEYRIFQQFLLVFLTSFLILLPYWIGLRLSVGATNWQQMSTRSGMLYTHQPLPNKVLLAALAIFLPCLFYEFYKKRQAGEKLADWWWFCLSFLLGGLLALNQQIITGRTIWPYHFVQYTIPLAMIAIVILFFNFIRPKMPKIWLSGIVLIFISVVAFALATIRSHPFWADKMRGMQQSAPVLAWLNNNTSKDAVVLVKEPENNLATLIPALTVDNVYWTDWFPLSLIPVERIYHNYLIYLRINEIKPAKAREYLKEHQSEIRSSFFVDLRMVFDRGDSEYINEKIEQIAADYQGFAQKDLAAELKKYRLDYIVSSGPLSQSLRNELPTAKDVFNSGNTFIYSF
ncbi:MAG: hypothetical protein UW11_C0033G0011 [Parcubacteria group bacterium GW2011_GWA2_43_9b]|nr:MAG: hypothetical protein UW11_C0033G0011 [Parcubacteria group bacterium GW2011_GWA2_43_9b]